MMTIFAFRGGRRLFPVAGLVLAIAALQGCGKGENSMQKGFDDGFKTQFVEKFNQSCTSGAAASGAPADKIAEVCGCTADALIKKHSTSELMNLSPEAAMPVMKECAAKSGLSI
ncbi:hypothetical protein [Sphingopyxis panaciterrae]